MHGRLRLFGSRRISSKVLLPVNSSVDEGGCVLVFGRFVMDSKMFSVLSIRTARVQSKTLGTAKPDTLFLKVVSMPIDDEEHPSRIPNEGRAFRCVFFGLCAIFETLGAINPHLDFEILCFGETRNT